MQLIKPAWLTHSGEQKDFEIYSCHVSPDGSRLATAGGDGHVRIWSTAAVLSTEKSYTKPRQLCHMSHHLGTIHSVRFSPNGRYLASGADDKIICIYHLDPNPPSHTATFGTNEPPPVENWKTSKRLVGHENDVQDLAWSNDSSILVSVGLDSKIVVWSGHTFEKLKTIAAHQSHVKGITFDPANKFFATASDDRTVKIFRFTPPGPTASSHDMVNNFVLETTITQPFKSSPLTTYFRRCSWSPDGHHISAANAVNGPISSVSIIERATWDADINLIGHEGPTEVCVFSPRLFHTQKPAVVEENGVATNGVNGHAAAATGGLVTVIASAGQDKTLTIWNTNTSRPVVICQDIASKSVVDLAWAPDGQTLFACSLDGTVVAAKFETGELGWVAEVEETDKALQAFGGQRKGMGVAEDVDGLNLENRAKEGELKGVESRMGALMGDAPNNASASAAVTEDAVMTNGTAPEPTDEQRRTKDNEESTATRINELKTRVTIDKDGRKRVAPLLVSSSGTGQSSLPQTQLVGAASKTVAAREDGPLSILDISKPYDGLPQGGLASMLLGDKRKAALLESSGEISGEPAPKRQATGPVPIMTNGLNGTSEPVTIEPMIRGVAAIPESLRPAVLNPSLAVAQVRLGVPKIRSHIIRPLARGVLREDGTLEEASRIPENLILEARNPVQARDPSQITVTKRGALVWQDYLPRAVILVSGNKDFWAAACEDGSLYLWTPAGRRLTPPLVLESQPVILECRNEWLLCITAAGLAHVWNIKTMASPHPPVTLAPILEIAIHSLNQHSATPGASITSAHLNSTGHVVVTLSNGDGYYYAREMYTWQRLSESWWAVGSQYWNSNDSSISALQSTAVGSITNGDHASTNGNGVITNDNDNVALVSAGIVPFLERHTTTEFLLKGRAYTLQRLIKALLAKDGFEGFESTVSIAHLETRIAGTLQLGAMDEFRLYLFMYAKRIGAEGLRGKVEELLNMLLGGILRERAPKRGNTSREDELRGWFGKGDEICGWKRTELLKGVVMILGKFRELQRLTVQYARVLGMTSDQDNDDEDDDGDEDADATMDGANDADTSPSKARPKSSAAAALHRKD